MKKQLLLIVFLLVGTILYGQEKQFSVGPVNFRDNVACKINLEQPTDLIFKIKTGEKVVKTFEFKDRQFEPVLMDLSDLEKNKSYTLQIFDNKKKIHEVLIKKLN